MALLAAVAMVTGGACAQGGETVGLEVETSDEELTMKVSVRLDGGLKFAVKDRTVAVDRIFIGEGGGKQLTSMLSILVKRPIVEGNQGAMPGVVLIPFEGDGTYTIEPTAPVIPSSTTTTTLSLQPKFNSGVRVEWWPADRGPEEYDRVVKPCTAKVEDEGMKGRLRCPDMTHDGTGGPNFSLDFRWEKA